MEKINAEWGPSVEARDVRIESDHDLGDMESGIRIWGRREDVNSEVLS